MKCVRDLGMNEHWAILMKRARKYHKKFWKKHSPFVQRCRTCEKVYRLIDLNTRQDKAKRKILHHLKARLLSYKHRNYKRSIKWQ